MSTENNELIKFQLPKDQSSIIKVIGVGGGGSNAVNHMFRHGITGVDFLICNTDNQALEMSPVPNKIQLGRTLTEGRGAGAKPEIGLKSALESVDDIKALLSNNTKMVFITAGMGGGTGTGAAPVIAQLAREMDILTVGIVTIPFGFEGKRRKEQAEQGVEELKKHVDTLLVISNDKIRELYGDLTLTNAFSKADDVLTTAAKGISEIITVTGYINVDFEDVKTVMTDGGAAIMGSATSEGENRAIRAIEGALASPLLNDNDIRGAKHILLYMTFGNQEISMDEMGEITDYIQELTGTTEHLIFGTGHDSNLGDSIGVTLIATGFKSLDGEDLHIDEEQKEKVTLDVEDKKPEEIIEAIHEEKFSVQEENKEVVTNEEEDFFKQPEEVSFETNEENPNEVEFKVEERPVEPVEEPEKEINLEDVEKVNLFDDEKEVEEELSRFDLFTEGSEDEQKITDEEIKAASEQEDEEGVLFKPNERLMRLKEISMKLKTPSGLKDLENEPAYKRRNVDLEDNDKSEGQYESKYSVGEDKEEGFKLKENNSFLHGSVD